MGSVVRHTNFGGAGVSVEKHATTVRYATSTAEEAATDRLARLHGLEGKVSSHGLRNVVAVVTVLNALLGNVLYLGSPVCWSVELTIWLVEFRRTCSGTRSVLIAQSC